MYPKKSEIKEENKQERKLEEGKEWRQKEEIRQSGLLKVMRACPKAIQMKRRQIPKTLCK